MQTETCLLPGAGALAALAALLASPSSAAAQTDEVPKNVLAVQLRKQGFECKKAMHAERDPSAKPGDSVWLLTCDTGRYRMNLIPNMAAKIEKLPDEGSPQSPPQSP